MKSRRLVGPCVVALPRFSKPFRGLEFRSDSLPRGQTPRLVTLVVPSRPRYHPRMSFSFRPLLVVLLVASFGVTDVRAQGGAGKRPPPKAEQAESDLTGSVRRVERQTGGEVLRVEPMQRDGREVYRLKVLTSDGRVRVMQDDPQQRREESPQQGRKGKPKSGSEDSNGDSPSY